MRRVGDQLRVSTELTNIEDREQKWSQKFDRSADDIFAIQDEIAKGVVGTLGGVITRVEAARALRQPPENLQAWELTRRALAATWDWRPETPEVAIRICEDGIARQNYAEAAKLHANPAINLDHYIEHFKSYHVDKAVGAELSDALQRLKATFP